MPPDSFSSGVPSTARDSELNTRATTSLSISGCRHSAVAASDPLWRKTRERHAATTPSQSGATSSDAHSRTKLHAAWPLCSMCEGCRSEFSASCCSSVAEKGDMRGVVAMPSSAAVGCATRRATFANAAAAAKKDHSDPSPAAPASGASRQASRTRSEAPSALQHAVAASHTSDICACFHTLARSHAAFVATWSGVPVPGVADTSASRGGVSARTASGEGFCLILQNTRMSSFR